MNGLFPRVDISDSMMSIYFMAVAAAQSFVVTCVMDYTDFGDLVGIEVLDWRKQLSGGRIDGPSVSEYPRWSYDDEIDALYIRTSDARGQNQQRTTASVDLDASQRVVALQIALPSPTARS
jgi:hypothetical protein